MKNKVYLSCLLGFGIGIFSLITSCGKTTNTTKEETLKNHPPVNPLLTYNDCPLTVTVESKSYGLIVLNWEKYAPNTNTYVTVTVVPYDVAGTTRTVTESKNTGSLVLEGYGAGSYAVYYSLQPASSQYAFCSGV